MESLEQFEPGPKNYLNCYIDKLVDYLNRSGPNEPLLDQVSTMLLVDNLKGAIRGKYGEINRADLLRGGSLGRSSLDLFKSWLF